MKTVFCTPYLAVAEVQVVANLNDGGLTSVTKIGDSTQTNNVTTGTQAGKVFNGLALSLASLSIVVEQYFAA